MSIEEKAKAYDKALEDMRVIYPNLKGDAKLAVEHAFPQLRESEDERIIREMLEYFTITRQSDFCSRPDRQAWIAWLEKQKEQKPAEWGEEDEKMLADIIFKLAGFMGNEKNIAWLKSLRPSWKPSKEQIATLEKWLKDKQFDGASRYIYPIFESLYEQLQKLM